jgi:hypothetical protein
VTYVVQADPRVNRFLDKAGTVTRQQYQQIVELLREDPFPSEDFTHITEHRREDGSRFFRYFDELFGFAVEYAAFTSDVGGDGFVWISEIYGRDDEFLQSL